MYTGVCHNATTGKLPTTIRGVAHWSRMRFCVIALATVMAASAQSGVDDFQVYTEHPRLLLNSRRIRLLKRERERQSLRWNQFQTLMQGKANMPEPAFAGALLFQVTDDPAAAAGALQSAIRPGTDVRQTAIAWDWCQSKLTEGQRSQLKARLERSLKDPVTSFASARDRAFAALVLGQAAPLRDLIEVWWRREAAPALRSGTRKLEHTDLYPFAELFHVIRDNLQTDLREDILPVFRDMALRRILSYYPAPYPAAENEYHIPYFSGIGEPDLKLAAMTRAGELALVAYESNAQEMQFLQGWLLHDRFILRGAFGAPYEFLWANPYHPGLPFEKLPLLLHDTSTGTLLMRSSWDEDASWLGVARSFVQFFKDGQIRAAPLKTPLPVGEAVVLAGPPDSRQFTLVPDMPVKWFLISMTPLAVFDIEVDDEEMTDGTTDTGGILGFQHADRAGQTVVMHKSGVPLLSSSK